MLRQWLYDAIRTDPTLVASIGTRVYQATSIVEVPSTKPFVVYRFGTSSQGLSGNDRQTTIVQPLQVFFHDVPGDYEKIDQLQRRLRAVIAGANQGNIIRCEWLEDSEDLRDDEMFTIFKYSRYQLNHKE